MSLAGARIVRPVRKLLYLLECRANYAIQSVKPHVPLIKFRKGGHAASASHPSSGASGGASSGRGSGHTGSSRATIEDYQLPARYRRQPMDQKEIDYINRGGPE